MCGSSPNFPAVTPPAPPPVPPTRDDPQVNVDAAARRRRMLAAKGRKSTIKTSALGIQDEANIGQQALGGS